MVNAVRRAVGPAQRRRRRRAARAHRGDPGRACRADGPAPGGGPRRPSCWRWRRRSRTGPVAPRDAPGARPAGSDLALLAADTHLRLHPGQLPLGGRLRAPEVLSRWFSGRVPFNLALPDYPVGPGERKPYHLMGGSARRVSRRLRRLRRVPDGRPAHLAPRDLRPARVPRGRRDRALRLAGVPPAVGERPEGDHLTDKGLTYALASDLSVDGSQSCTVCHGSPQERRRLESFSPAPQS